LRQSLEFKAQEQVDVTKFIEDASRYFPNIRDISNLPIHRATAELSLVINDIKTMIRERDEAITKNRPLCQEIITQKKLVTAALEDLKHSQDARSREAEKHNKGFENQGSELHALKQELSKLKKEHDREKEAVQQKIKTLSSEAGDAKSLLVSKTEEYDLLLSDYDTARDVEGGKEEVGHFS
jgi:chromosome segregation ATPase